MNTFSVFWADLGGISLMLPVLLIEAVGVTTLLCLPDSDAMGLVLLRAVTAWSVLESPWVPGSLS